MKKVYKNQFGRNDFSGRFLYTGFNGNYTVFFIFYLVYLINNEIFIFRKEDAENLLLICEPGVITKTRYEVKSGYHTYEIDEFHGENEGLIIAEIELENENEEFIKPDWLGKEVTGDERYYNIMLMKNPYKKW